MDSTCSGDDMRFMLVVLHGCLHSCCFATPEATVAIVSLCVVGPAQKISLAGSGGDCSRNYLSVRFRLHATCTGACGTDWRYAQGELRLAAFLTIRIFCQSG
eukprot:gnl/TRDRNA2_/TRDRNA2_78161_c0_seq2.p3 gnl/TRDRNA2_/TRDRNA2_78161_c0~~gnl/TRDRNA2_/TRDRNA2_78161_c0_seq2.p3  ORF type:complete len:102 (+),score=8.33 gnl/TRDRNA2_/TRDRNA2_78161_c0_seq2:848-1153(+)